MLQTIKIKNFALIENAEIPFETGLNILSGETGAGKSIVLGAISLLLGGRANADVIRNGSDEAIVEGYFETQELPWLRERLKEVGFESSGDGELLIKRTINRNGKNRIFINGELATLSMLQAVCEDLVDLCGQHEHQSLFKSHVQLDLIDRYSELEEVAGKVKSQYLKTIALREEWELLKRKEEERVQRLEFIRFQIQELNEAGLKPGEDEILQQEKKLLQSHEQRISLTSQIEAALDGEDASLHSIKLAFTKVKNLLQIDSSAQELYDSLSRSVAEVEEASRLTRVYLGSADLNPNRLEEVQERLSLITNFKRKYGQTIDEIIAHHEKLASEIDLLENLSTRLEGLEEEFQKEKVAVMKSAKDLYLKRKRSSESFAKSIDKELKELRMGDAHVAVKIDFQEYLTSWGSDSLGSEITF